MNSTAKEICRREWESISSASCSRPAATPLPFFPADEMLTKQELAAKFKVSVRTIEKWTEAEFLPVIRKDAIVRYYWPRVVAQVAGETPSAAEKPKAEMGGGR